ncbi:pyridoxal phosphate-dependent aminotransferase [Moheibacter sediminis]|uniref:Aspartate aminotransferase n=1 Tax=Moheibacter sediminis TaxID=1434700 RepID=A0A1W1Z679_9FLAO|nr:pyridoxal phosphate-dependent aminotransferase [Moheibacter sediminis]SMC43438.1 aspartate aminotransferase [Moheibacter sediminis]
MKTSILAENLKGSAIIKLAGEVNALKAKGEQIYNLTIGDFDSTIFPIPQELKQEIVNAYESDVTNYPAGNGEASLRKSVSEFLSKILKLNYKENEILISGGARPLIYAVYQAVLDIDDTVLYPVPSWNNDAYTYLARNKEIVIETLPENKFMPTAEDIAPHIQNVNLIAVCSPLNPTGTTFDKEALEQICDLIVTENQRRNSLGIKPLYLLYDQIYWQLTYGETVHYNPVSLNPEMRDYTIFIDGISKAFAATGVRVGWAFGPDFIIDKMKDMLGHIGAWAPKPEQVATGKYLELNEKVSDYLTQIKSELSFRLDEFYKGFNKLKNQGFPVDVIEPEAALYLTVKFDLVGKKTESGDVLNSIAEVTNYLLKDAKVALVPFSAFGASKDSNWFRLSVGTTKREDIEIIISQLKNSLEKLN